MKVKFLSSIVVLCAFGTAVMAQSQDSIPEGRLEAVTVTAQKQREDLQKVPFAVSSVDAELAERMNLWNVKELRAVIPNLYFANPGDNRNVIAVRGITTTSYEPAVATYVNGVNQFGLDTYFFLLNDIERIEVLRGPQGTLYGRNSMGGVINIITREPSYNSGFAKVDVGNYGLIRTAFAYNIKAFDGKLGAGFLLANERRGGFYINEFDNERFDKQRNNTLSGYIDYNFGKGWRAKFDLRSYKGRNHGAFTLAPDPDSALENPFRVNQNATTRMVDETSNFSMAVTKTGGKLDFTSVTAYQQNYRYYEDPIDGDFSPADAVSIINNYGKDWNTNAVWTQELRLAGKGERLDWQFGVFGFLTDAPTRQGIFFGEDAGLMGSPMTNFTNINTNKSTGSGIAVFGQGTYRLDERLSLTLGLRADYEEKKLIVSQEFDFGEGPFYTVPDTSGRVDFTAISPKLALGFTPAEDHNWYVSYSRGYRPGGLTQIGSDPSQPPLVTYDPEFSNNLELGTKNYFLNHRVRFNAAVFLSGISDVQVPALILPDALVITSNAGDVRSYGVESEFSALLSRNLVLDFNVGYTHATYTNLSLPGENGIQDFSGNRQLFTPEYTSFVSLEYTPDFFSYSSWKWLFRGELQSFGKQFFNLENTFSQDAFSLVNLKVGVTHRNMEITCWAQNIFDATYIDYAYNFGASHLGNPATYGGGLTVRF